MKRKLLNPLALIICSFLFVIAIAADLNGKWVGVISIPGGGQDLDVAYNFKVDGEKLTGRLPRQPVMCQSTMVR
jgi:hypothetical protein